MILQAIFGKKEWEFHNLLSFYSNSLLPNIAFGDLSITAANIVKILSFNFAKSFILRLLPQQGFPTFFINIDKDQ